MFYAINLHRDRLFIQEMKIQTDVEIRWNLWQVKKQVFQAAKSSWIMEKDFFSSLHVENIPSN